MPEPHMLVCTWSLQEQARGLLSKALCVSRSFAGRLARKKSRGDPFFHIHR